MEQPVENYDVPSTKKIKTGEGTQNDKSETNSKPETSSDRPVNGDSRMSDEMFAEYKRIMREKQKHCMQRPKLFLTLDELTRDFPNERVTEDVKEVPPLFITDVQNLLLYSLQGNTASCKPRWCQLLRVMKVTKVIAVVLDSLSKDEYETHSDYLPTLKSAFDVNVKLVPPVQYGSSVREELLNVPFSLRLLQSKIPDMKKNTFNKIKKNIKELQSFRERHAQGDIALPTESTYSEYSSEDSENTDTVANKAKEIGEFKFDRRLLMLSPEQMIREGIPMPYDVEDDKFKDFVYSKSKPYREVHGSSPLFAVDCEMVQTTHSRMDLARVSVVNESLETVYDTYVKPSAKIVDYVTRFSGITKAILGPVKTTVEDVQRKIDSILPPDAILCGQSIGGDLRSLKMFHPYVIDTSVIYNLTGDGNRKTGLKKLSSHFLSKTIQDDDLKGHNSVEDATATMELVLLKLKNDLTFGNYSLCSQEYSDDQEDASDTIGKIDQLVSKTGEYETLRKKRLFFQQTGRKYTESFIERISRQKKTGVVIDEPANERLYSKEYLVIPCATDKQREIQSSQTCQEADFCLTHLYGYRDFLVEGKTGKDQTEDDKQKCLWKLDRRLWKIMRTAPTRSVFVVILTGRQEDNTIHQAMTFAKVV